MSVFADEIARLEAEIDNLKTTLTEDLHYQRKLEDQIERVESKSRDGMSPLIGDYARGYNDAMGRIQNTLRSR